MALTINFNNFCGFKKMKNNTDYRLILLICLMYLSGCHSPETNQESTAIVYDSTLYQGSFRLMDNAGVRFEYQLGEQSEYGENYLRHFSGLVINDTDKKINYLNQSCNGLKYYVIIEPDTHKIMPSMYCEITLPSIDQLAPGDSAFIYTGILEFKDLAPIRKIGLDFRMVNQYIPDDTIDQKPHLVERIYRSETQTRNVIWGKKK